MIGYAREKERVGNMDASELKTVFAQAFPGTVAPFVCGAPGRVNIIGEHTDYNGLPVLPMTLDRGIVIACSPRDDATVRLRAAAPGCADCAFVNGPSIPPSSAGAWENYVKAAVEGINGHFKVKAFPGMDLYVAGTLPMSAGLSSSSALVVAASLAYLRCLGPVLERDISRLALASLLAGAEQYVGTRGGGMDQAIILNGNVGAACKIDFFPLRVERVPLPASHVFVICHSLVKAEKTGDALHRYNAGPRLCRLITAMVQESLARAFDAGIVIDRLGDLWNGHLCMTSSEVEALFAETFPAEYTPLADAAAYLGTTPQRIRERWLEDLAEPPEGFALKSRARHQLTEYLRVQGARDALLAGDAEHLGELMNASHASCAHDYAISCPELDTLTEMARAAGALGSRLTGAGFGGCTVSLVERDRAEAFMKTLQARYYSGYIAGRPHLAVAEPMFAAQSGPAAGYLD